MSQWLAASRMVTSGMVAAPVDEPPAPANRSVMVRDKAVEVHNSNHLHVECAEEDR